MLNRILKLLFLCQLFSAESYAYQHFIQESDTSKIDSVNSLKRDSIKAELLEYQWKNLSFDSNLLSILEVAKIKSPKFKDKKIDINDAENFIESVLKFCEDHGYPFANLYFDRVSIRDKNVEAQLKLKLNTYIVVDSIRIMSKGNIINEGFIESYIGIKPGDEYNETSIRAIDDKINNLGFIRTRASTALYFVNDKAEIVIYPDKINANRFDGILGIQPNTITNKTSLVGQLNLSLINTLKRAERFNLDFRAQPNSTRDLKIYANYPYIFNLPFGVDATLNFRRQDSSFSIFSPELGISYLFNGINSLRVLYKIENSTLLSTSRFENALTLPNILDVNKQYYGLNLNLDKTNYRLNPSKGYRLNTQVLFGNREIRKNSVFTDSLYDDILLRTSQIVLNIRSQFFIPIYKKNIFSIGLQSGIIESEELLFNELFRIGGINDLRGFDEESIFNSKNIIINTEYRFLFDKNSFIRTFYDQVFYENKFIRADVLRGSGIGLGIQLETNAGLLQLNYALGRLEGSSYSFQNGKIHFGIINYF